MPSATVHSVGSIGPSIHFHLTRQNGNNSILAAVSHIDVTESNAPIKHSPASQLSSYPASQLIEANVQFTQIELYNCVCECWSAYACVCVFVSVCLCVGACVTLCWVWVRMSVYIFRWFSATNQKNWNNKKKTNNKRNKFMYEMRDSTVRESICLELIDDVSTCTNDLCNKFCRWVCAPWGKRNPRLERCRYFFSLLFCVSMNHRMEWDMDSRGFSGI